MIVGLSKLDIFKFAQTRVSNPCAVVVTTNTCLRDNGNGIMGAGIAAQAREMLPDAESQLGSLIRTCGECVGEIGKISSDNTNAPVTILAFPTKRDYHDPSSLDLIRQSAQQLQFWANQHPNVKTILLPPVGCGLGGLDWESQVYPVIAPFLPGKRFIAFHKRG